MEMLDQLAFNCTKLRQDLLEVAEDSKKQQQVLREYLELNDSTSKPIADFPTGERITVRKQDFSRGIQFFMRPSNTQDIPF